MLVDPKKIFNVAREEGYGIPSASIWDEEQIKMVLKVAEENRSPVGLSIHFGYPAPEITESRRIFQLADSVDVPVTIDLDHGRTFEQNMWAIHVGLPQMMVDRSDLSFEENLAKTKELVRIAHAVNVYVEGEVGRTGNIRDSGELTDPEELKRYVEETGVDMAAVSVGNLHGTSDVNLGGAKMDWERIEKLTDAVSVPLSIHGGSGIPSKTMSRMVKAGLTNFHMQNYLNLRAIKGMEAYVNKAGGFEKIRGYDLRRLLEACWSGWVAELADYINALGSKGKA
jgi:fructose-bisphosphate aldolase class II